MKYIGNQPPPILPTIVILYKTAVITNVGDWSTELLGTVESKGTFIAAIPSLFIAQLNDRLATLSNNQFGFEEVKNTITITPNPSKFQITIHSNQPFNSKSQISIFTINGQIIKHQTNILTFSEDNLSFNFDVSDLSEGIYFAEISSDTIYKSIKFIVKK